jgi:hypothetical protein
MATVTAFSVSPCPSRRVFVALLLGLAMTACKLRAHAPAALSHSRPTVESSTPAAHALPAPVRPPAEDPFAIPDDEPIDPVEALQAARHNCCDEMPADQVKAHRSATEGAAPPRAVQRRVTAKQP